MKASFGPFPECTYHQTCDVHDATVKVIDMPKRRLGFATVVCALMSAVASAQNATVNGRVTNTEGGAMANANVTLRLLPGPGAPPAMPNMPGMNERTTNAGPDGSFAFDQVAPGEYVLQADLPGFGRSSQAITVPGPNLTFTLTLEALDLPGAVPATATPGGTETTQELLDRIKTLEQRLSDLEAGTVLSEPETRVRRVEVYVDANGNQTDQPVPGARQEVTYQRERVYRRQTISEKIDEALADAEQHHVQVGVSAAIAPQFAVQTTGSQSEADGHAYQLASADVFFTAGIAQHTLFYADIVGLSGTPPDLEISGLTLLNGYSARLVRQNEIGLREAWLRTELFSQRLALTAGRLDLTNFFDRNAAANDETTQFLSDALVNNPVLGLATNGSGTAAVFDPKNGLNLKAGFQQSNPDATNLNDSIYSLVEVGYLMTPFGLGEGNYRLWYRATNASDRTSTAWGVSLDQKVAPPVTLFARYGDGKVPSGVEGETAFSAGQHFWSGGVTFRQGLIFNPADSWGVGYAQTRLAVGDKEHLVEGYYSFQVSEKLRLSFHLTHSLQAPEGAEQTGFLVPGVRLQASF
jgi:hypothetical protein